MIARIVLSQSVQVSLEGRNLFFKGFLLCLKLIDGVVFLFHLACEVADEKRKVIDTFLDICDGALRRLEVRESLLDIWLKSLEML